MVGCADYTFCSVQGRINMEPTLDEWRAWISPKAPRRGRSLSFYSSALSQLAFAATAEAGKECCQFTKFISAVLAVNN